MWSPTRSVASDETDYRGLQEARWQIENKHRLLEQNELEREEQRYQSALQTVFSLCMCAMHICSCHVSFPFTSLYNSTDCLTITSRTPSQHQVGAIENACQHECHGRWIWVNIFGASQHPHGQVCVGRRHNCVWGHKCHHGLLFVRVCLCVCVCVCVCVCMCACVYVYMYV